MPMFIKDTDTFEVRIYKSVEGGKELYHEVGANGVPPVGWEEMVFVFKRPAWGETKDIMSNSIRVMDGKGEIDLYKLMDARLKVLLRAWPMKDEDGNPVPVTPEDINRLSPPLVDKLNAALGANLD